MEQKRIFTVFFLLIPTVDCQVTTPAPTITTPTGQLFYSTTGSIAYLSCTVENVDIGQIDWVFLKDGTMIYHGGQLMVNDKRYSLKHLIGSSQYDLQIYPVEVTDQGNYRCGVSGTNEAITIKLIITDANQVPAYQPVLRNYTDCCIEKNVSQTCMSVCMPSRVNSSFNFGNCIADLDKLVQCGTDGRNHEDCCASNGVSAHCLPFCSNTLPPLDSLSALCLSYTPAIIACYDFGAGNLPSPPQAVSVLSIKRNVSFSLLVSWKPPVSNPAAVNGYRINYKNKSESAYNTTSLLNAVTTQYEIKNLKVNNWYSVTIVAVGVHGSSQPSNVIEVELQDTLNPQFETTVAACCELRQVPLPCQSSLCHTQLWSTFNISDMLSCYSYLPDVFSCLAGERDHTTCCTLNHVAAPCLGLCSGVPPPFNKTLTQCVPKLSTVEACVQLGFASLPSPPRMLTLIEVKAHSAILTWEPPENTSALPIVQYAVQLRRGNESASWFDRATVQGTFVELTNLTETENYAVRVIAQNAHDISLPSQVIRFTTYPEILPTEPPTIVHNLTQCCQNKQMPDVCANGCKYAPNMTDYYRPVLNICMMHIGTVLSCASDGRDHTSCCRKRGVKTECLSMCSINIIGPLDPSLYVCIEDTAIIVMCFEEGLESLVRLPEDITVTNITSHSILLDWVAPRTGPRPSYYIITYHNAVTNNSYQAKTNQTVYVMQNLQPSTKYDINVTSYFNDTYSPPSPTIIVFTYERASETPISPSIQANTSRMLWTNRTHCCSASDIIPECKPVCMNLPAVNGTDCSSESQKILLCAADGKDHSFCCKQQGLAQECLPLCSSHNTDFSVITAGCMADTSLSIITSCYLSYSDLLPSAPNNFTAQNRVNQRLALNWAQPALNCPSNSCEYDIHFWPSSSTIMTNYFTIQNVTPPFYLTSLEPNQYYTLTVTARNSFGISAAAPWFSVYFVIIVPHISIAQQPQVEVHENGTQVVLICDAYSFGEEPNIAWKWYGYQVGIGRQLILKPVTKDNDGNYTCFASTTEVNKSVNSHLNVRYKPELYKMEAITVRPSINGEAILTCWFTGHPLVTSLYATWTKDGKSLAQTTHYSISYETDLYTGIGILKLKIAGVEPQDYGVYQCNASNLYGYATGKTKLLDPDKTPPPVTASPDQIRNASECCVKKNVPAVCLPLCTLSVSVFEVATNPVYKVCVYFFTEMVTCATDGSDHTKCCQDSGVVPLCWPFCAGGVPSTTDIKPCFSEAIIKCLEIGYGQLPSPPLNVVASMVENTIKVQWNLPKTNPNLVDFYTIFFNSTQNTSVQTHTVSSQFLEDTITDIDTNLNYSVWLVAFNQYGSSQSSNVVTVSKYYTANEVSEKETLGYSRDGLIAGVILGIVALVAIVIVVVIMYRRHSLQRNFEEFVSFESPGNSCQNICISGFSNNNTSMSMQPQIQSQMETEPEGSFNYYPLPENQTASTGHLTATLNSKPKMENASIQK